LLAARLGSHGLRQASLPRLIPRLLQKNFCFSRFVILLEL
jgi:hypothetical protein